MAFFFCCLVACLALALSLLANRDFLDTDEKQGVFLKSDREIIDWGASPILTFGGVGSDVILSPNCKKENVAVVSVVAGKFYVQCNREYSGLVERRREGDSKTLDAETAVTLQDYDQLRFWLPELDGQNQDYRFLTGNLNAAQIIKKLRGRN